MTNLTRPATRPLAALAAAALLGPGFAGASSFARKTPGVVTDGRFAPTRPPSESFGPPGETPRCATQGVFQVVLDRLAETARRAGRTPPEADGRACAVAEAFLGWDNQVLGSPRPQVVDFVSRWYGLPVPAQIPTVALIDTEDFRILAEKIVQSEAAAAALNAVRPVMGIVTTRVRRGTTRISVVIVDAPIQLDPFPRRLALGASAKLSGRLLGGLQDARVYVSDAQGRLSEPEQAKGTDFQADVACGDRPGTILVEVRGELDGSSGVVASIPVACGRDLETSVAVAGETWPQEPAAAERRILEAVNADRVAAGLQKVVWDDAISTVAREISKDLAARAGAPGGMDVGRKLKQEGIASPLVLQAAAAERTVDRAHERLQSSPVNRANLLHADVTNAGIGVHEAADDQGRKVVYVTEILIKEQPPVDVPAARQSLRDAVARKRRDARAPAIEPDAGLDELAQRYAAALAASAGDLPKATGAELTAALEKGFRGVVVVAGARQETLDLAEEGQVTSPGKLLGVGIAQGRHPVLGRSAVYAVIAIASPRK